MSEESYADAGYADVVADEVRQRGLCDDSQVQPPPEEAEAPQPEPLSPAQAAWKAWDPWGDIVNRDPWTKEWNLKMSEKPTGLITAKRLFEYGTLPKEDLEVVEHLSPKPEQFVLDAADTQEALSLIDLYLQNGVFDQAKALSMAETLAQREAEKARVERERIDLEYKKAEEAEAAKERREKAKEEIWERYHNTLNRISEAEFPEQS